MEQREGDPGGSDRFFKALITAIEMATIQTAALIRFPNVDR